MGARRFPTLRAQWLGRQLKQHRIQANVTLAEAGEHVQRDQGTVSRIESGLAPARISDTMALLNLYGVDDPTVRSNLELISRDSWQRGWWDGYSKHAPAWMLDLAWMEGRAEQIYAFDPIVPHGLLQTADYARALMSAVPFDDHDKIEHYVQLRMDRNQILNGRRPVKFQSIIDESVIRRPIGGTEVTKSQLDHLVTMAKLPHIDIRVLPGNITAHAAPEGAFALLNLPEPYPQVAHIDTVAGNLWVEGDEAVGLQERYARITEIALSPAASITRIEQLIKDLHELPQRPSSAGVAQVQPQQQRRSSMRRSRRRPRFGRDS